MRRFLSGIVSWQKPASGVYHRELVSNLNIVLQRDLILGCLCLAQSLLRLLNQWLHELNSQPEYKSSTIFRTIIDPSVTNEISYSFHRVPYCYSFSYTQANLWSEGHKRMQQPYHDDCRMVCSHRNGRWRMGFSTWARQLVWWLWSSEAQRVKDLAHAVLSLCCDFFCSKCKGSLRAGRADI